LSSGSVQACCTGLYELPLTRLLLGSSFHPGGLALSEKLARSVALGPDDHVLDLASGRGDTALFLAGKYGCSVVGLDASADQVKEAEERCSVSGLSDRVSFVRGDALSLPFAAETFDLAFCECALCTFSDRLQAVSEVERVLKKAGRFALSDVILNEEPPEALRGVLGHVLCIAGALSQEGYEQTLSLGGFTAVRYRDASDTLLEMTEQMKRRSSKLGELADEIAGFEASNVAEVLLSAEEFIRRGGVGYATFTSRKPAR